MITFDPAQLDKQVAELERRMQQPDFWNDQAAASRVSSEYRRAKHRLDHFRSTEASVADAEAGVD
ncbi:MAG: PCRF domain-containing protein, partial [Pseudomonadota bacterium]